MLARNSLRPFFRRHPNLHPSPLSCDHLHTLSSPPGCALRTHLVTRPSINRQAILRHTSPVQARPASFFANFKTLARAHPFTVPLAVFSILVGASGLIYANYIYSSYIIGEFTAYPEPVAAKLRRALYFTNHDLQPERALKYFSQALQLAHQEGMDPLSDAILGVKAEVSKLLVKVRHTRAATEALEIVLGDCLEFVRRVEAGELGPGEKNIISPEEMREQKWADRSRVLGRTVGMGVRLGELYAQDDMQEFENAEARLVQAVTTMLREKKRRDEEGVREGEGEWMTGEEMGAALESLANHYEAADKHFLATPLYLQAVSLCPPTSCHSVVLMNNLSISLAQQSPHPSLEPHTPPASRTALISNARTWATKALDIAAKIVPPERSQECNEGCAVATHNLGEFAEMEGNLAEARRKYEEARSLSRGLGFKEGVERAEARLNILDGKGKG
ncbi:MAG: hypothetical protein LQ342_005919 [Letrouitia transgressa]|nr:MAG: hypothetical protein LQ342_005919 [Letrouitia transgressa]